MRTVVALLILSALCAAQTTASAASSDAAPTIVVPAGTKVPLVLKNAVSTKSARPGDAVYLQTTFPITQNNRIVIPAGAYVQGVINRVQHAGRVKGKAEVQMHFTTMIFPSGYTISLPGTLENVAGAESAHMKDKEGTVQSDSQKGKDAGTIASTAGTGAVVGGLSEGGKGAGIGAGIGGAVGTALVLLTRGNEVRLQPGTTVEMVLQRPLELEEARLTKSPGELVPVQRGRSPEKPVMTPPPGTR